MEGCGLNFSACFNCITSGNYLVKLASNFSFCCAANPATLSEPVMITYSKLSECPPDMSSTYILAGTIGSVGLLVCLTLLGFCILKFARGGQSRGRSMPVSRVRYQREDIPLLTTVADFAGGEPNYGFSQETEQNISHGQAARNLGSICCPPDSTALPVPATTQVSNSNYDLVYHETVSPPMKTFRAKRPTSLSIKNPIYENTKHFPIV